MPLKLIIHCDASKDYEYVQKCAYRGKENVCLKVDLPNFDVSYEQTCQCVRPNKREDVRRKTPDRRINAQLANVEKTERAQEETK